MKIDPWIACWWCNSASSGSSTAALENGSRRKQQHGAPQHPLKRGTWWPQIRRTETGQSRTSTSQAPPTEPQQRASAGSVVVRRCTAAVSEDEPRHHLVAAHRGVPVAAKAPLSAEDEVGEVVGKKLGENAMLVDAGHAFDPAYSKALRVDIENLIVCQPDNGETALEIADRMCRSGAIDLICIDAVSALTPRAEIEGADGFTNLSDESSIEKDVQATPQRLEYSTEVTSGGIALKFFASLRLEIRHIGKIKSAKGDEDVGVEVRVKVQKSKVSRPYKQAEFEIMFGEVGRILDCAELMEVVAKKDSCGTVTKIVSDLGEREI
ncbi:DNA repair protein recA homolog 1, chloroplastic-like [Brachypodium distachyon]|uniref:DNA repair protein recA homolog 1, chloroplastic-like n=1 Tax=Brachypodium distachyon TaxID=15368 RepID=UPI000D0CB9D8|nr:DNA repair protein recA homolog 1, chloroplastic-like [Brachypodium distachyon]|eukprot:XP_024312592.1 DNA repair protein recA homolog 1, chloroplastic-like [Brachypodium distachyon]